MKLARRIILLMLATFLGVLATLGYFESRRAVRDYRELVASELAITGRALRAPLLEVLDVEGDARALKLLEIADADITHMEIHWSSRETPSRHIGAVEQAKLARGEEVTLEEEAGGGRLFVYVPVGTRGAIELSQPLTEEHAVVLGIVKERFVVAIIAVLCAALLTIVAGVRIVGEPMRKLADHARRIGHGDLTHRLSLDSHDEIGQLAIEMNGMADRLAEAQRRVTAETDAKLEAMEQLRHADRLRTVGTLASGMAHELGTPLSVIGGRAKMIAQDSATPAQSVQFANVISGQVDRMTKIMRGLLDFARRTPTAKARIDVRDIARRSLELLGPLAKKQSVKLTLADDAEEAVANVDAQQVEQAIANLVVNGIQAMTTGEVVTDVRTVDAVPPGEKSEHRFVRVSVRDAGRGMAKEEQAHVFEPFFTTKDVGVGTGLGLSVTYGIVHEHGGFVDMTSEVGVGSCFFLYFPA